VNGLGAGAALAVVPRLGTVLSGRAAGAAPGSHPSVQTIAARSSAGSAVAPAVVRRSQWGANEALRRGAPRFMDVVEKVIVHHTATNNDVIDWAGQVRQICDFELANGYEDIAYHFLVDPNGVVYEGRYARDYAPDEIPDGADGSGRLVHGGHAINHNSRTVGIALLGDYTKTDVSPAMLDAVVAVIAWLCDRYRIDPLGASNYATASGAVEHLDNICPHGATTSTECPGTSVLLALPTIRQRVAERLAAAPLPDDGYWIAGAGGRQLAFGAATALATAALPAGTRLAGLTLHPDGEGYWAFGPDGGVFAYGDARFHGGMAGHQLNAPIVGLASCRGADGYWLASSDGGVFAFGKAPYLGSVARTALRAPIVDIARTPSGRGFWLAAADGGIFAFGDARFHGAAADQPLRAPITAMAPSDHGYWLVGADGGVFAFGDAHYAGGASDVALTGRAVDIAPTPSRRGYLLLTSDGDVLGFGDATPRGNARGLVGQAVGLAGPVPRR
jgi:hypothetical protein